MKKTFRMQDLDCANCAAKMETAAGKTPGVVSASVNFFAQKMTLEFSEDADVAAVMKAVVKSCRKATRDGEIYL